MAAVVFWSHSITKRKLTSQCNDTIRRMYFFHFPLIILGMDSSGRPTISSQGSDCSFGLGSLHVKFHGGARYVDVIVLCTAHGLSTLYKTIDKILYWPFPADACGKQWFYAVFNTESEAKSLFAASIGLKWSITNIVYRISQNPLDQSYACLYSLSCIYHAAILIPNLSTEFKKTVVNVFVLPLLFVCLFVTLLVCLLLSYLFLFFVFVLS